MKSKFLLSIAILVFMISFPVFGQVVADFETDENGFVIGWGGSITNLSQVADPSGITDGVLAISVDADLGDGKAAIKKPGPLEYAGAKAIAYSIWLPAGTPDDLVIKVWVQANGWKWNDDKYLAADIGKETWFPIYFNSGARTLPEGTFEEMGIEIYAAELTGADTAWAADVYLDNVTLLGVEPEVFADFENDESGFVVGWGNGIQSLAQVADPTGLSAGVLAIDYNADEGDTKAAIKKSGPIEHMNANLIAYNIWLPANTPDDLLIKIWVQANGWQWNDDKVFARDLAKEAWVQIFFSADRRTLPEGTFEEMGLEIYGGDLTGADTTFAGMIYLDNGSFLSTNTGKKWVQADFENESAGTSGFTDKNWGPAMDGLAWGADPTGTSTGVLTSNWTFTGNESGEKDSFGKFFDLGWTESDTGATSVSIDVFVPQDFPTDLTFSFWGANDPWIEAQFKLADTTLAAGAWNTLVFDVIGNVENGYDPLGSKELGLQIFSLTAVTYNSEIVFDNLTLWGIEKPEAPLKSPAITVADSGSDGAMIEWVDNEDNLQESYNIYMSKSPISDLADAAVIKIATSVGRGTQSWWHRPWSDDGSSANYYYAVTAVGTDGVETELTGDNQVGPIEITSNIPPMAVYDNTFSGTWFPDADLSEFTDSYSEYKLVGVDISGDSAQVAGWEADPLKLDVYWEANFVIDDKYLYVGVQVLDDYLTTDRQAWEGDAWELFIGLYDIADLKEWHGVGSIGPNNVDRRIGFHADGTTHSNGGDSYAYAGLVSGTDYLIEPNLVGYTIEARLNLDSLAIDGFTTAHGMMLPMKVDNTDIDTEDGDEGRSLILQWGSLPVALNWQRPSAFGRLMVYDPNSVGIEDNVEIIPASTKLKNNYPNPFNPSTTINFDLAKKGDVSIIIYNVLGQKVKTLLNNVKNAGNHQVVWNGLNQVGNKVVSGVYFIEMTAKNYSATKKMLLVK